MMKNRKWPEGLSDGETVEINGVYYTLKTMFGRQVAVMNDDPRNPHFDLDETEVNKDGPSRDLPMPKAGVVMRTRR